MAARVIRRTVAQPADGSDFDVVIDPAEANDSYGIAQPVVVDGDFFGEFDLPDEGPSDRTTSSFRVLTAAPLPSGTVIEFILVSQ